MDNKCRRHFKVFNSHGMTLAYGICYDEMNVQILWRADYERQYGHGYCAEQYSHVQNVLDIVSDAVGFAWILPLTPLTRKQQRATHKRMPYHKFLEVENG